jgi:hypothetical protein
MTEALGPETPLISNGLSRGVAKKEEKTLPVLEVYSL